MEDFTNINLYRPEIALMHLENPNIYLNNKQLGVLARKVLTYFLNFAGIRRKFNYPFQMGLVKDLLLKYRTEQVLAGIYYWTAIRKGKIFSIKYLTYDDSMQKALTYFRAESLNPNSEYIMSKVKEQQEKFMELERQEILAQEQKNEEVKNMSDEDWVKQEFMAKFLKKKGD